MGTRMDRYRSTGGVTARLACARSILHLENHDLAMADGVNRISAFVERKIVQKHRRFFLHQRLFRTDVEKHKEPVLIGAATCQKPFASGVKFQVFDQSLELFTREN